MMMIGLLLCMFVSSSDIVVAASCLIGLGYGGLAGGILPTLTADLLERSILLRITASCSQHIR
jgi:hypothetical protein